EYRHAGRTGSPANSRRAAGGSLPDKFRRRFHALELAATRVAVRAGLLSQSPSYRCSFQGSPIIVVAKRLPEAGLILFHKADSPDPFGTFPKIEMRHEQPSWTTMRWWNRQALIPGRDHPLTPNEISDGDVCCVTPVAMSHDVESGWLLEAYRLQ